MEVNTVGDLIRLLSRFDPELPIMKSQIQGIGFSKILMQEQWEHRVGQVSIEIEGRKTTLGNSFMDTDLNEPGSFNAIIL